MSNRTSAPGTFTGNSNGTSLQPRQQAYLKAYTDPDSPSFGNSYQSARSAGYTDMTARNLTHLKPDWLSENIGQLVVSPDEIMRELTAIIQNVQEPTVVRLKAIEMTMRAYSMMVQRKETKPQVVTLNVNLSGSAD